MTIITWLVTILQFCIGASNAVYIDSRSDPTPAQSGNVSDEPVSTNTSGSAPPDVYAFNQTYLDAIDESHKPMNGSNVGGDDPEDNCHGSHYCNWTPWIGKGPSTLSCELAYEQFEANTYYQRYTSYYHEHCTAIYDCWPPQHWSGFRIALEFDKIRKNGCEKCGIHYFNQEGYPPNSCYVKLDYCWSCRQEGSGYSPDLDDGLGKNSSTGTNQGNLTEWRPRPGGSNISYQSGHPTLGVETG